MSSENKPYLFELFATKVVVIWAPDHESAIGVMQDNHFTDSGDWTATDAKYNEEPITEDQADTEVRHGAIEDRE